MGTISSQITSLMIVSSTVYSGANQWKHQSSASLAFVRGIHRWPVNSPHKGPVTRKMFPFDDVIMNNPDSKAHGASMGHIWGRQDPGGSHVGPMNFAIWEATYKPNSQCCMKTSSNGNIFRVTGHLCGEFSDEFPAQRAVTRSFDVFFDLRLNKRMSKQSRGWWFETLSCPLWRCRNGDYYTGVLLLCPRHCHVTDGKYW